MFGHLIFLNEILLLKSLQEVIYVQNAITVQKVHNYR